MSTIDRRRMLHPPKDADDLETVRRLWGVGRFEAETRIARLHLLEASGRPQQGLDIMPNWLESNDDYRSLAQRYARARGG